MDVELSQTPSLELFVRRLHEDDRERIWQQMEASQAKSENASCGVMPACIA